MGFINEKFWKFIHKYRSKNNNYNVNNQTKNKDILENNKKEVTNV